MSSNNALSTLESLDNNVTKIVLKEVSFTSRANAFTTFALRLSLMYVTFVLLRMASRTSCTRSGVRSLRRSPRSCRKPQPVSLSLGVFFETMPRHTSRKLILRVTQPPLLRLSPLLRSYIPFKLYYSRNAESHL